MSGRRIRRAERSGDLACRMILEGSRIPVSNDENARARGRQGAGRVLVVTDEAPEKIDIAYMQKMQGDGKNLNAETLVPLLMQIPPEDSHLIEVRSQLEAWDLQNDMDSISTYRD